MATRGNHAEGKDWRVLRDQDRFPRSWCAIVDIRSPAFLKGVDQIFKCRKTCFVVGSKVLQQPALVPSREKFCGQATQPLHLQRLVRSSTKRPGRPHKRPGRPRAADICRIGRLENELPRAPLSSAHLPRQTLIPQDSFLVIGVRHPISHGHARTTTNTMGHAS
jgi:hypothetical protein